MTSTSWDREDAIVVSEIGARLSPKQLPARIAPQIRLTLQPIPTESGIRRGPAVFNAPAALPVALESTTQIKKQMIGISAGDMLIFVITYKSASIRCDAVRIFDITPANKKQAIINAKILSRTPSISAF